MAEPDIVVALFAADDVIEAEMIEVTPVRAELAPTKPVTRSTCWPSRLRTNPPLPYHEGMRHCHITEV
jgi:hypothetical protein